MYDKHNGIALEFYGNKHQKRNENIRKLEIAADRMDNNLVEEIIYRIQIHEPADYNNFKKMKLHIVELRLKLGKWEEAQQQSWSKGKSRNISFRDYYKKPLEDALGMKLNFHNLKIYDVEGNEQPLISLEFIREVKA